MLDGFGSVFDFIGNAFSSAVDSIGSLFGDSSSVADTVGSTIDAYGDAGNPQSAVGQGLLSEIDMDNSGSIGSKSFLDFQPGVDYSSFNDVGLPSDYTTGLGTGFDMEGNGYGTKFDASPLTPKVDPKVDPNAEKPWYSSLLSPAVIGAAITSGAGYLGQMNQIDLAKQAQAAKAEEEKRNSILALAKLKYQLMGKGAPTGGRRAGGRSAGGGGGGAGAAQDQQYSASLASGYGQLGNALANIYRG